MSRLSGLVVVYLATAILNIGLGMLIPILPVYARSYGAPPPIVGLIVSAPAIGRILFQGLGGYLADIYQDRKLAVLGISLYIPPMILMALLPHPLLFIILRFIEGVAEGLAIPALYSIIATRSPSEKMGTNFGLFTSSATAGLAMGPVFGGIISNTLGPRGLFFIAAAVAGVIAVLLSQVPEPPRTVRGPRHGQRKDINPFKTVKAILKSSLVFTLMPVAVFSFLTKFAFADLQVILPLYLTADLGFGDKFIGFIFSVNFLLYSFGQPLAGWMSDKLRGCLDILISGSILAVVFLLLPLARSPWIFLMLLSVEAFAASWTTVSIRHFIGQITLGTADTGKAYGMVGTLGDLGALTGPLIAGTMYQWGPPLPFWLVSLVSMSAVFFFVKSYPYKPCKMVKR